MNRPVDDGNDAETLALMALGWVLSDGARAERLLSISGLTPEQLRGGMTDRTVLAGIVEFLEAYEPDLVAAAAAIGVEPQVLAAAGRTLGS